MPGLPKLLRDRGTQNSGRVGWVELFFDLVFVYAVTQLSHLLLKDLSLAGMAKASFMMVAVWVTWMWTTWATNWLDTRHTSVRLLLFALMAGGLVLAAAIPESFADRALAFACAYVFIHNARNLFLVLALRNGATNEFRNFLRIQVWLILSGVLWISGAVAEGESRCAFWLAALAMEFFSPWWGFWVPGLGRSTTQDWSVDPEHMAERCGLFVIVVLGESIIMTGATFSKTDWDAYNAAAFVAAFVSTAAMWWIYFATTAEEASERFERHENPGEMARAAYTYVHLIIVAGAILSAVGDELVLAHPMGHMDQGAAVVVTAGPALFLMGSVLFRWMLCGDFPTSHLAGLGLIAFVAVVLWEGPPVALAACVSLVLAGVGAWETIRRRRQSLHNVKAVHSGSIR